jgi:hypothetical protein
MHGHGLLHRGRTASGQKVLQCKFFEVSALLSNHKQYILNKIGLKGQWPRVHILGWKEI